MIENRNESELEAHLRRVVKHSGNLSGLKIDRGNEKSGPRMVRNTHIQYATTHTDQIVANDHFYVYQYGRIHAILMQIPDSLSVAFVFNIK